jgi:hypothetical protein
VVAAGRRDAGCPQALAGRGARQASPRGRSPGWSAAGPPTPRAASTVGPPSMGTSRGVKGTEDAPEDPG